MPKLRIRKSVDMSVHYKEVFNGHGSAKIVLDDIFSKARVLSNIYDENPREHAYNEGRRSLALEIIHMLKLDIDEVEKRIQDHIKHDREYK